MGSIRESPEEWGLGPGWEQGFSGVVARAAARGDGRPAKPLRPIHRLGLVMVELS